MKIAALLVCLVSIAAAAGQATAQTPARRVCDPGNSQRTTIQAIASDPAAWLGSCVTLSGIYANERLYADEDAIYGLNAKAIGGYVDGQGDVTGFWNGQFTGRVADCTRAEDDLLTGLLRSPGISLNYRTLGCLEPRGPFLVFMSQSDLKPARLVRRLPGASGADLKAAPGDWEHRAQIETLASAFLAGLRAGDRTALSRFVKSPYAVEQLVAGEGTAIDVLKASGPQRLELFSYGPSLADAFSSEACFCLVKDCTKRWPIARRDADNQASRPYACLRIDGVREAGAWRHTLDPSRDFDGLPERAR